MEDIKCSGTHGDCGRGILSNSFFIAVVALFCCALWGSASPMIKIGYEVCLPEVDIPSSILFAGIRFLLSGIMTVTAYCIVKRRFVYPKSSNIGRVLNVSVCQTVIQYIFFYIGISITTGVKATVISGTNAFFAILISSLIFKMEKLNGKKIIACILGFAGVILININGIEFTMNIGDICIMCSNIAYALSSLLMKKYSEYEDPVVISGYQFVIGGAVLSIAGFVLGGRVSFSSFYSVCVILYLALLSALAYSLWGVLLKYNHVSKVTVYSFMIPVFGVLISNLLLDEQSKVTPFNLTITLILMCFGIVLLNYKNVKV